MRRIGVGAAWLATLAVVGAFVSAWVGWLDLSAALDLTMGVVGLTGLWLVVWLPWDLYFAARKLAVDQADSVAAGVEVPARDREAARQMAPRLLALCVGLHVCAALVVAGVTWASGGQTGYYFAGFFLLSMALRPVGALYHHARLRLTELSSRARYPREDVVALEARVVELESLVQEVQRRAAGTDESLSLVEADTRRRIAGFDAKVEQVLRELERSVGRLTADRELLAGIKAFVRVVRQS